MARPSQEEQINEWVSAIIHADRFRRLFGGSANWETYRNYYRGKFPAYHAHLGGDGVLPYNVTYAMASTIVPNVYFRNPYVTVSPRMRPNMEAHAKLVEGVDNWLIEELSLAKVMKSAVLQCFFCGRGIIKVGYDSQFGFDEEYTLEKHGIPGVSDTTATQLDKKAKKRVEFNRTIKPGMPWAVSVDPDMFLVPYGTRTMDDCEWADHMVLRRLRDVQADPKYKNTSDLSSTHFEKSQVLVNKSSFMQELCDDGSWVLLHEIRNLRTGEVLVFPEGHHKFIRGPVEDPLQIEGLPYVSFTFNEDPEYFWAPSDAQIIEPQQLEMNEARTQSMLHRRLSLVKVLIEEGAIDDVEIDKMLSSSVMPAVKVKSTGGDVRNAVAFVQPTMPQDLLQWTEAIRYDVRELTGMGRQQMGAETTKRKTATESQIVAMASQLRLSARRGYVGEALREVIGKFNQLIFAFWDKPHIIQVAGYDGAKYWVEFTRDAIIRDYNLNVDVEGMTPQTKQLRRRELVELIQALSNNPRANIDYLMRLLVREYGYVDAMKVLPPAQETQQQAMPAESFVSQQQRLLESPDALADRVDENAARMALSGVEG